MNYPQIDRRDGRLFFTMLESDRASIATSIERLIDLLDAIDGDPDLEPYLADTRATEAQGAADDRELDDSDLEPSLGWCACEASYGKYGPGQGAMEEELVNEDGGDIQDENHDGSFDDEPNLGWSNPEGLRVHVPEEMAQLRAAGYRGTL